MRSGRRTWAAVIAFTEIVRALDRGSRRTLLGDSCRFWIDVPNKPVVEQTVWRIRIVDNQNQRLRFTRNATDLQLRTYVRSVAGKLGRNIASGLKGGAGDRDRRNGIHIKDSTEENCEGTPDRFHSATLAT